ncbi:hypothetical protein WG66_001599 [Moniliophthora roreri]|uniref:Uncharacterized protein n=1 Tax=Moniliophthora roreri TaxID=221103 RepID=A0A0W0F6C0_MONRR|nr:hypothetical protein WG66_001599 [Moniliophthora roreri]
MASIQGSSNFRIHNSQLTIVKGPQQNTTHIHNNQVVHHEKEPMIQNEYRRVRCSEAYLTRLVSISDTYHYDGPLWSRNQKLVVRRTFSLARVRGEDKGAEFLYVGYSGPEAFKAFKQDFARYSTIKNPNVAQLLGYNDQRGLPALIFYDALIPLNHVLSRRSQVSWILRAYFRFQLGVTKMFKNGSDYFDTDELWIEPRSGALRRGPYVQSGALWLLPLSDVPSTSSIHPLSIQAYSDITTVVDCLVRILPTGTILKQVSGQYGSNLELLTALEAWPYLASSLSKRNQRHVITRWTGLTRYVCVYCSSWAIDKRKFVMEDGSVRFQFADPTDFKGFWWLQYELFHGSERLGIRRAWLAQLHSVFHRLGIHEEEWEKYSLTTRFDLDFCCIEAHTGQHENDTVSNEPAPYLFVRCIPRPSDDEATWRSWAKRAKYFWSFDASGREEMSESTRVSLGLPSFTTKVVVRHCAWNLDVSKAIEGIHLSNGFDPKTTDLACSLGYPLMEVGNEGQFQELKDSTIIICDNHSTSNTETESSAIRDTKLLLLSGLFLIFVLTSSRRMFGS